MRAIAGSSSPGVRRVVVRGRQLVVKSARGSGRSALRRESEVLRCLDGSAAVEVVALLERDDRSDLVTVDGGDQLASTLEHGTAEQRLARMTAVAAALADLHTSGWSHGAVCADHVVFDDAGHARWCSLGSATPIDPPGRVRDTAQLLEMLRHVAAAPSQHPDRRARAGVRRLGRRLRSGPLRPTRSPAQVRPDELARDLAAFVAGRPRLAAAPPMGRRSARPLTIAACALVVLVVGALALAGREDGGRTESASPDTTAATTVRPLDATPPRAGGSTTAPRDVPPDEGVTVAHRGATFRIGSRGDRTAVGDWDCDGTESVILLRPATGELFHFDRWADADRPAVAEPIRVVPTASQLEVVETTTGCHHVSVRRVDGSVVDLASPP